MFIILSVGSSFFFQGHLAQAKHKGYLELNFELKVWILVK